MLSTISACHLLYNVTVISLIIYHAEIKKTFVIYIHRALTPKSVIF